MLCADSLSEAVMSKTWRVHCLWPAKPNGLTFEEALSKKRLTCVKNGSRNQSWWASNFSGTSTIRKLICWKTKTWNGASESLVNNLQHRSKFGKRTFLVLRCQHRKCERHLHNRKQSHRHFWTFWLLAAVLWKLHCFSLFTNKGQNKHPANCYSGFHTDRVISKTLNGASYFPSFVFFYSRLQYGKKLRAGAVTCNYFNNHLNGAIPSIYRNAFQCYSNHL